MRDVTPLYVLCSANGGGAGVVANTVASAELDETITEAKSEAFLQTTHAQVASGEDVFEVGVCVATCPLTSSTSMNQMRWRIYSRRIGNLPSGTTTFGSGQVRVG